MWRISGWTSLTFSFFKLGVGVDFVCWSGLLIVNFSRRNLVAIPVLNFWQGLELHCLLFLCNYRCKKSPHPVFVQNSSSEYYVNIFYIIIKQELKDYGTIRMKAVKLVIVFEKA